MPEKDAEPPRSPLSPLEYKVLNNKIMHCSGQISSPPEMVIDLIQGRGRDVNDSYGETLETPLHVAVLKGNKTLAVTLMQAGMKSERKDVWGHCPLSLAVRRGDLEMVAAILSHGNVRLRGSDLCQTMTQPIKALMFRSFVNDKEHFVDDRDVLFILTHYMPDAKGLEPVLGLLNEVLTEKVLAECLYEASFGPRLDSVKVILKISGARGFKITLSQEQVSDIVLDASNNTISLLATHGLVGVLPPKVLQSLAYECKLHTYHTIAPYQELNSWSSASLLSDFLKSPSYADMTHLAIFKELISGLHSDLIEGLQATATAHGHSLTAAFLKHIAASGSESSEDENQEEETVSVVASSSGKSSVDSEPKSVKENNKRGKKDKEEKDTKCCVIC
eukprot:TRINITY_DN38336_c0_g1_i1.p1 TRINITY_DN38336_c0_g1~~TRINITY_DN38336_c0_g1_i1.p1  ORF type:complete len:390 (+),score=63.06 TRINITY_DN38336_c0_g1_i1:91-1260(+)